MISLKKVERVYPLKGGSFYALHYITLDIREGEFVSIMGPSGSEKSTLLHILGMHDSGWTGEYWLNGAPVHELDKKKRFELQKQHIGFVFQSYHLLDDLTVYENLEVPLTYRNLPKKTAKASSATRWTGSIWLAKRTCIPASSRADSSSSWASPGHWWHVPL